MQSQGGSTSSQASFDSLSSSDSLLCSDSEQAEDDADVFLTASDGSSPVTQGGAGAPGGGRTGGPESPGSHWTCDGFTDKEEEESSNRSRESRGKTARVGPGKAKPAGQNLKSQGDLLFAQKCAELQGFVRPLLELLNGLKGGRFDRGLSSFQQSVAMDRIQRIVGVLQRPSSGEKYLNTLLQVEMMLKLWFPHIIAQPVSAASGVAASPARSPQDTSSSTPLHKHKDQSHIPVKKRRLSWTSTDSSTPVPVVLKCPRLSPEEKTAMPDTPPPPPPSLAPDAKQDPPDVAGEGQPNDDDSKGPEHDSEESGGKQSKYKAGQSSEPSLTWVHLAPIPSPRKACPSRDGSTGSDGHETQPCATVLQTPGRGGSPAMQDSSVSSTTVHKKQPKNLNKPAIRCQSQPVAGQQSEGDETDETCPSGQNQPPLVTLLPLPAET